MILFYCITFLDYIIAGRTLLDHQFMLPDDYRKNDQIIYKYFENKFG